MQKNTGLLVFVLLLFIQFSFSQKMDSTKRIRHFGTVFSVTTKGISTIPSFTLGKPAVIFDISLGTRKLSFEPQFRFALEGKPWSSGLGSWHTNQLFSYCFIILNNIISLNHFT